MKKYIYFILLLFFLPFSLYPDSFIEINNFIEDGKYDTALNKLAVMESNLSKKNKYLYYYYTGKVYFKLKDYPASVENFLLSIKLEPDWHYSYHNLGWAYQHLNDFQNAVIYYKKAIKLFKTFAIAYFHLGNIYLSRSEYRLAKENYKTALKYEKNKDTISGIYNGLGKVYLEEDNISTSIECFNKSLNNDDSNWRAYMNRGLVYFKQDQFEDALDDFNQVIKYNKNYYLAYFYAGNCYHYKKDNKEMEMSYKSSVQLKPDFTDALYLLAAYYAMEKKGLMLEYLKKLFSVDEEYKSIIINDKKFKKYKDDNDFIELLKGE